MWFGRFVKETPMKMVFFGIFLMLKDMFNTRGLVFMFFDLQ